MSRYRIGIDTGGTFTDVVAFDESSGRLVTTKTPTTPADPSQGFMAGIRKVSERFGFGPEAITSVAHGTTIATNAVLAEEGAFPGLGLIVTRGFRHILEIARQSVPAGYGGPSRVPGRSVGHPVRSAQTLLAVSRPARPGPP